MDLEQRLEAAVGVGNEFEPLFYPVLDRLAALVHLLPASQAHHHSGVGGMYRHCLEVAHYTAQNSEAVVLVSYFEGTPRSRRSREFRWRVAAALAGLFHDLGKVVTDMRVATGDGRVWSPLLMPLYDWCLQQSIDRYYIHFRKNRNGQHDMAGVDVIAHVWHASLRDWLAEPGTDILATLNKVIAGAAPQSQLGKLVRAADKKSVERDLSAKPTSQASPIGIPMARHITDAIRRLVNQGTWGVNKPGARVWVSRDGPDNYAYIVWHQGSREVGKLLRGDRIPGVPHEPASMAEILFDTRQAIPYIKDERECLYWPVVTRYTNGKTLFTLKVPADLVFPDELPTAIEVDIVPDSDDEQRAQSEQVGPAQIQAPGTQQVSDTDSLDRGVKRSEPSACSGGHEDSEERALGVQSEDAETNQSNEFGDKEDADDARTRKAEPAVDESLPDDHRVEHVPESADPQSCDSAEADSNPFEPDETESEANGQACGGDGPAMESKQTQLGDTPQTSGPSQSNNAEPKAGERGRDAQRGAPHKNKSKAPTDTTEAQPATQAPERANTDNAHADTNKPPEPDAKPAGATGQTSDGRGGDGDSGQAQSDDTLQRAVDPGAWLAEHGDADGTISAWLITLARDAWGKPICDTPRGLHLLWPEAAESFAGTKRSLLDGLTHMGWIQQSFSGRVQTIRGRSVIVFESHVASRLRALAATASQKSRDPATAASGESGASRRFNERAASHKSKRKTPIETAGTQPIPQGQHAPQAPERADLGNGPAESVAATPSETAAGAAGQTRGNRGPGGDSGQAQSDDASRAATADPGAWLAAHGDADGTITGWLIVLVHNAWCDTIRDTQRGLHLLWPEAAESFDGSKQALLKGMNGLGWIQQGFRGPVQSVQGRSVIVFESDVASRLRALAATARQKSCVSAPRGQPGTGLSRPNNAKPEAAGSPDTEHGGVPHKLQNKSPRPRTQGGASRASAINANKPRQAGHTTRPAQEQFPAPKAQGAPERGPSAVEAAYAAVDAVFPPGQTTERTFDEINRWLGTRKPRLSLYRFRTAVKDFDDIKATKKGLRRDPRGNK